MKYEELKFENKETEKKDREGFNEYYNICKSLKGMTYEQARRKAFNILNDANVGTNIINKIMDSIDEWIELARGDNKEVLRYIEENKNEVQTEFGEGWEGSLYMMLDP